MQLRLLQALRFFADPTLPAFNVTAKSNYHGLWAKTKAAFQLIYEKHKYVENSVDKKINLYQNEYPGTRQIGF